MLGRGLRRFVDSSDLAQEVHLAAERELDGKRFANRAAFRGWLGAILRSVILREARARRSIGVREMSCSQVPSGEESPSRQFGRLDTGRLVRARVDELPERDRRVLLMRVGEDEPFARIGERLGITEGHARVVFHRALAKLRPGAPECEPS